MMFAFERLPLANPHDSCFPALLCRVKAPAWAHQRFAEIEAGRREFNAFFAALRGDAHRLATPDELKAQSAYLSSTYDLLAIGVQGSFSPAQRYASLLNEGESVTVNGDLRLLLFAEFIFSRYTFALGAILAAQRRFSRFVVSHRQGQSSPEEWSLVCDCFVAGFGQLARLYTHKALAWTLPPAGCGLPAELSQELLELLWRTNELNFCALLTWGCMYRVNTFARLSACRLPALCKNGLAKLRQVDEAAARFTASSAPANIAPFQRIVAAFFSLALDFALLAQSAEAEGEHASGSRRDLLAGVHWQKALLGEQLLRWRAEVERLKPGCVFARCLRRFWADMAETAGVREALTVYPALKADIGGYLPVAPTLQSLYDRAPAEDVLSDLVRGLSADSA